MNTFIYLSTFSTNGGIERFNRAFIHALSKNCMNPSFFSLYDKKSTVDKKYLTNGVFHGAKKNRPWTILTMFFKLLLKNNKVLVVGHLNLAPIALLVKFFRPKVKMILIAHGIDVWDQTSFFKIKFIKKVDEIWAVSQFTKDKMLSEYGLSEDKIEVFSNTLDPFFKPKVSILKSDILKERYSINPEDKVILTLCRISSNEGYKGYDRVVEALSRMDISKILYLIVGKYDEDEKNRIELIARSLNVFNSIRFTSFIDESEIVDHYQLADLFVMPSLNEGFGIVYLEAMACGVPVIAGNKDGSVDALKGGQLGTLVDPNDVSEIAVQIEKQLNIDYNLKEKQHLSEGVYSTFGFDIFKERQLSLLKKL